MNHTPANHESALSAEMLRRLMHYDPNTGVFTWKKRDLDLFKTVHAGKIWNVRFAGTAAGKTDSYGYIAIGVNGARYRAHRLAWLYVYGEWPTLEVDHANCVRDDNRIGNLRQVTHIHNLQNQKAAPKNNLSTGVRGVSLHKASGKFIASLSVNRQKKHLGLFSTVDAASKAYISAKEHMHAGYVP